MVICRSDFMLHKGERGHVMRGDLYMSVYIAVFNNTYRVCLTHNPVVDALFFAGYDASAQLIFLTPFLPVGVAYYIYTDIFSPGERRGSIPSFFEDFVSRKEKMVKERLEKVSAALLKRQACPSWHKESVRYPIGVQAKFLAENIIINEDAVKSIKRCLAGRLLFLEELEQAMTQNNYEVREHLNDVIQWLVLHNQLEILPSVQYREEGLFCNRCGNKAESGFYQSVCGICSAHSIYCQQCVDYGEARLCRPLFCCIQTGALKEGRDCRVKLARERLPELSPAQKGASQALTDFVKRRKRPSCLLWAVAGAGKTEVVLEAMDTVLQKGGNVLYAAPRRDVVIELAPRLQHYFPGPQIAESYGGSQLKYIDSAIAAATTHQVLRFYRKFDLVILDEADAYPYKDNQMLHMAVGRSIREGGKIITLTATPDEGILSEVKKGLAELVTIPARHHGYPLPEPILHKMVSFTGDRDHVHVNPFIIDKLAEWLKDRDRQVFVFLPTVTMIDRYGPVLQEDLYKKMQKNLTDKKPLLKYSHAKDKERDEKREAFKQGEVRIFLTTTIMERGITVKKANVLVLNADYERVFDQGTLIQMAGRAGRSREHPQGEVIFIGQKISTSMKGALRSIQFLNKTARQKGYLKGGL